MSSRARHRLMASGLTSVLRRYAHPLAVAATLLLGLAVTSIAWRSADATVEALAQREFENRVAEVRSAIRARMLDYAQVLRGAAALFAGSDHVTRRNWGTYVASLQLEQHYPGARGLGFVQRVPEPDRAAHEAQVRAEGFTEYAIQPGGVRTEYMPVVYMEPLSGRNLRMLGFDMYSKPVRHIAMQRAIDSGEPAITVQFQLAGEKDDDTGGAFIMYLAVYRNGAATRSVDDRRSALAGFVFGSFLTRDVMSGLAGAVPNVRIEIFDALKQEPSVLLYDSAPSQLPGGARYAVSTPLLLQERAWTVRTSSLPEFDKRIDRTAPQATLAAGIALSIMLAVMISVLMTLRARALALAGRMTEELRESRQQLALALEGSNLALYDYDLTTGMVKHSERWNALLGGPPRPMTTTIAELEAIVHPEDVPRVKQALKSALKREMPFYRAEHRVRAYDGSWKWIASHAKVAQRDANGRAVRLTGTNADITERKAGEDLKDQFIGTVSHELRTPLTGLIGSLSLLKEEEYGREAPPEAAMFLDMAYQNSERLAALVNDILDLEKIASGTIDLDIARVELRPFLHQAISLNSAYAAQYSTRFELEAGAGPVAVRADRARFMQALTNLMSNAAKHSPAGEPVILRAILRGERARIEVVDRGPGVPEAIRERIFQKFVQAAARDGNPKGGTGLGLAISKAIVEVMEGRIGYDSTGAGTVFYIELPAAI